MAKQYTVSFHVPPSTIFFSKFTQPKNCPSGLVHLNLFHSNNSASREAPPLSLFVIGRRLSRTQRPRKPSRGQQFCDLKRRNKCNYCENRGIRYRGRFSGTAEQRLNLATQLICKTPELMGNIFSENFCSICSALSSLHLGRTLNSKNKVKQTCLLI